MAAEDELVGTGWRPLRPPSSNAGPTSFSRLALPHLLTSAGDACIAVALAGSLFFDLSPSAARSRVALSLVLTIAPFAVVAPFLGPAIDRVRGGRRFMVIASAAGRAVVCLLLAERLDALSLFPLAFMALVLGKAHGVAKSSLVPSAVDRPEDLVQANSKLSLIGVVGGVTGSIPAAIAVRFVGGGAALLVGALFFTTAAIKAIRIVERAEKRRARGTAAGLPLGPHLLTAAAAVGVLRFSAGMLAFLLAFSLRRLDAPAWWFAAAFAANMSGTLLGATVAPRLRGRFREESLLLGCLAGLSVAAAVAARADVAAASILAASALGLAASVGKLAFDSMVQQDGSEHAHGRDFARFEAVFQLAWVLGALIPTALVLSDRTGLFLVSATAATAALLVATGRSREPGKPDFNP